MRNLSIKNPAGYHMFLSGLSESMKRLRLPAAIKRGHKMMHVLLAFHAHGGIFL